MFRSWESTVSKLRILTHNHCLPHMGRNDQTAGAKRLSRCELAMGRTGYGAKRPDTMYGTKMAFKLHHLKRMRTFLTRRAKITFYN